MIKRIILIITASMLVAFLLISCGSKPAFSDANESGKTPVSTTAQTLEPTPVLSAVPAGDGPSIKGVAASANNASPVTPFSDSTDIAAVTLKNDDEVILDYQLGTPIILCGSYTLTITDKKGLSAEINFTVVPGTPSIKLESLSYNSIQISWSKVSGADYYEVYRSESESGPFQLIGNIEVLNYLDAGLTTGNIYYYRITAISMPKQHPNIMMPKVDLPGLYTSEYSPVGSAYPELQRPSNIIADYHEAEGKIAVSWGRVEGAARYELYRSDSPSGGFALLTKLSGRSYTDVAFKTGQPYFYKVRAAIIVDGKSIFSKYSSVVNVKP